MSSINDLSDCVLILAGYAYSQDQLVDNVKTYWNSDIKNIIVSTYSPFITDEVQQYAQIVCNDDPKFGDLTHDSQILLRQIKTSKIHEQTTVKVRLEEPIFPDTDDRDWYNIWAKQNKYFRDHTLVPKDKLESSYKSISYHILTARRGINLAREVFPEAKYYFRLRTDMRIDNLAEWFRKWKTQINRPQSQTTDLYNHKFVVPIWKLKKNGLHTPFYISDYCIFGYYQDVIKYYQMSYLKKIEETVNIVAGNIESYTSSRNWLDHYQVSSLTDLPYEKILADYYVAAPSLKIYWYKIKRYLSIQSEHIGT